MNPFSSLTSSDLGVSSSDIINSALSLVQILVPILLISLALIIAPKFFNAIRSAVAGDTSHLDYERELKKRLYESRYDDDDE